MNHFGMLVFALLLSGCMTSSRVPKSPSTELSDGILFSPAVGHKEVHKYLNRSDTTKYESGQKVHRKKELVTFDIHNLVTKVDQNKGQIYEEWTTKNKEGDVDLHALAFPEGDETLRFVFDKHYNVLLADRFPKSSHFFVPPVFLPKGKYKVGETWTNTRKWRGLYNDLPLRIDITSILKSIRFCPGGRKCAEIEASGSVKILGSLQKLTKFNSLIQGRFLVDIADGKILWSSLVGEEVLVTALDKMEIYSCIVSFLDQPKELSLIKPGDKMDCNPHLGQAPPLP